MNQVPGSNYKGRRQTDDFGALLGSAASAVNSVEFQHNDFEGSRMNQVPGSNYKGRRQTDDFGDWVKPNDTPGTLMVFETGQRKPESDGRETRDRDQGDAARLARSRVEWKAAGGVVGVGHGPKYPAFPK